MKYWRKKLLVSCECGCKLFKQEETMQIDELDFRVWAPGSHVKADTMCITIIKCIKCGRIKIPSTSMMGKNQNSPEVKAYAELIEAVQVHNNKTANKDSSYDWVVNLLIRTRKLEEELENIKQKVCACKSNKEEVTEPIVLNEVTEIVETTKRGRKSTKSPVS